MFANPVSSFTNHANVRQPTPSKLPMSNGTAINLLDKERRSALVGAPRELGIRHVPWNGGMSANVSVGRKLPFLLEGRVEPSTEQRRAYQRFLRELRGEIAGEWRGARPKLRGPGTVESATDALVHLVLLQTFICARDPAAAPSIAVLLRRTARPSVRGLYRAAHRAIEDPLVRSIFPLRTPSVNLRIPDTIIERDWASRLTDETRRVYGTNVPVTVFGDYHQLSLRRAPATAARHSADVRYNLGIHYTPAPLIDYLTHRSLKFMTDERCVGMDDLRILDPSCGSGGFLVAALRFLIGAGGKPKAPDMLHCLSRSIHGFDVDRTAVALTLQGLLLTAWESCLSRPVDCRYTSRIRHVASRIRCADFLRARAPQSRADRPNVILGAPPFVRLAQLHRGHKRQLEYYRSRFATARAGHFDLYMLFVERALEVLAPGGCLGISVSGTFLRNKSGEALRKLISSQCRVIEIVEFDDRNVYPDASAHSILLTAWKTDERSCSRYVSLRGAGRCRDKLASLCRPSGGHQEVIVRPIPSCALTGDEWRFHSPECHTLLEQMESVGSALVALPVNISLGVCTGADDIFVLRHVSETTSGHIIARRRTDGREVALERGATRPMLRGRGISGYGKCAPGYVCVFPYDRRGAVFDEGRFSSKYPRAYEYLTSQRSALSKRRRFPERPWYALRKVDVKPAMAAPKLVSSAIGRPGGFTLDNDGVLCHNSVITIGVNPKTIDPYYLLGVLNSSPMQAYLQHRALPMGEGRCALRLEALRRIPLIVPSRQADSDLCATAGECAAVLASDNVPPSRRLLLLRRIDRLVMRLYGLPGRDGSNLADAGCCAG